MLNKIIRWLARDIILDEREDAYRIGSKNAEDRIEKDHAEELSRAYLSGVTDGVAIAVQEPGTPPEMMSAPKGLRITTFQLWEAIDRADIVRRGIAGLPDDRPIDVEGVMLRADQMRSLLRKKG